MQVCVLASSNGRRWYAFCGASGDRQCLDSCWLNTVTVEGRAVAFFCKHSFHSRPIVSTGKVGRALIKRLILRVGALELVSPMESCQNTVCSFHSSCFLALSLEVADILQDRLASCGWLCQTEA